MSDQSHTKGGALATVASPANRQEALRMIKERDHELYLLQSISAVLSWDMETEMPDAAAAFRGKQVGYIAGQLHEMESDPIWKELLSFFVDEKGMVDPARVADLSDVDKAFVSKHAKEYRLATSVPKELIAELSALTTEAASIWSRARRENDFAAFAPSLTRIVELCRKLAECYGYEEHPYDALLGLYEDDMTTRDVEAYFDALQAPLTSLVAEIGAKCKDLDRDFLFKDYDIALQGQFGYGVAEDFGLERDRGIIAESTHPFTISLGPHDVRLTTRYTEPSVLDPFLSTIHESGHALYELGNREELHETTLFGARSLGLHESQSRFVENMIAKNPSFWRGYYPKLKETFPEQLDGVDVEHFIKAVNWVGPSTIRVNADEVSYSLHVILRFRIEKALIEGSLEVADIPEAWNKGMQEILGILPPNDAEGALQDMHWAGGSFGYFPVYALGNLYGAMFWEQLKADLPGIEDCIGSREGLIEVRTWLLEHIHQHGAVYTVKELIAQVCGKDLDPMAFVRYLEDKYRGIFA